jgi:hypothetical protein
MRTAETLLEITRGMGRKRLAFHGIGHWRAGCGYKPHARFGGGSSEKGLFVSNGHLVGDLPYITSGSGGGRREKDQPRWHLAR